MIDHDIKIGERVVHVRTMGRIRGTVESITMTATKTTARVLVDGLGGRMVSYDRENLCPESSWERPTAVLPSVDGGTK